MSITITEVLRSVYRRIGLNDLPINPIVSSDDLIKIVEDETLRTFSLYIPNVIILKYNLRENEVPNMRNTYFLRIPNTGPDLEIVSIEDIEYYNQYNNTYGIFFQQYGNSVTGYINNLLDADMHELANLPIVWYLVPPDKIFIETRSYNGIPQMVNMRVGTVHHKNLTTIALTFREEFIKLATLDITSFLWEMLKRHDQIDTTFGQVNLKIDDWSNAKSEREDLLNRWQDKYIGNKMKKVYIG